MDLVEYRVQPEQLDHLVALVQLVELGSLGSREPLGLQEHWDHRVQLDHQALLDSRVRVAHRAALDCLVQLVLLDKLDPVGARDPAGLQAPPDLLD